MVKAKKVIYAYKLRKYFLPKRINMNLLISGKEILQFLQHGQIFHFDQYFSSDLIKQVKCVTFGEIISNISKCFLNRTDW